MVALEQTSVCFLAGTLGQGGAERQLYYMAKALRECNAPVRLLCLTSGDFWERRLEGLGVPVEWVGRSPARPVRLARIVASLLKRRPHIVQSTHFFANAYAAVAARAVGSVGIGAIRSNAVNEIHDEDERLRRWGLEWCRVVAANSMPAIRSAVDAGVPANKLALLPNVVDTTEFCPAERSPRHCFTIASVGRLTASKRHDRLLRVMARFKRAWPGAARLLIAGDGPCRTAIERRAAEFRLEDSVAFLGNCEDVRKVYRAADVLAITSDVEGTPNVALEAMASGLTVVSRKVGGVSDVVPHGVGGFIAESEDEEGEMSAYLYQLAMDEDLRRRFGERARAHVVENFSVERLPRYLRELYTAALSNQVLK